MAPQTNIQPKRTVRAKTDGQAPLHNASEGVVKRTKRSTVYNACESCRASKVKCNGIAPCHRCSKLNLPCLFTGRAHDRTQRDLQTNKLELAAARQELKITRQELSNAQAKLSKAWEELAVAQSTRLQSQQYARGQQVLLENIFNLLRIPQEEARMQLHVAASQSGDAAKFCQNMAVSAIAALEPQGNGEAWDDPQALDTIRMVTPPSTPGSPVLVSASVALPGQIREICGEGSDQGVLCTTIDPQEVWQSPPATSSSSTGSSAPVIAPAMVGSSAPIASPAQAALFASTTSSDAAMSLSSTADNATNLSHFSLLPASYSGAQGLFLAHSLATGRSTQ